MFLNTHSVWEKRKLRTVKPDQNKEYKDKVEICQKEIKEVQDKINILEAKDKANNEKLKETPEVEKSVEDKISEDNEVEVIEPRSISPKVIELVADSPEGQKGDGIDKSNSSDNINKLQTALDNVSSGVSNDPPIVSECHNLPDVAAKYQIEMDDIWSGVFTAVGKIQENDLFADVPNQSQVGRDDVVEKEKNIEDQEEGTGVASENNIQEEKHNEVLKDEELVLKQENTVGDSQAEVCLFFIFRLQIHVF